MYRRKFISNLLKAGMLAIFSAPLSKSLKAQDEAWNGLKIGRLKIQAGLEKPFEFLHFTDSHVVLIDERDSDRFEIGAKRKRSFINGRKFFDLTVKFAKERSLPMLCTGDVFDFVSERSLEFLKNDVAANGIMFAMGNHEFSYYVGFKPEARHEPKTVARVQACFDYDLELASHVIGGVNILTIDNSTYNFTEAQVEKLKAQIARGLPIIVGCHVPIYTEKFFESEIERCGRKNSPLCASLSGVPEDKLALYPNEGYRAPRRAAPATLEIIEILKTDPHIKGILCGHLHENVTDTLSNGAILSCRASGASGASQIVTVC